MHLLMAYEGYPGPSIPEREPSACSAAHRVKRPGQAHQRWASLESCHVPSWENREGHGLLARPARGAQPAGFDLREPRKLQPGILTTGALQFLLARGSFSSPHSFHYRGRWEARGETGLELQNQRRGDGRDPDSKPVYPLWDQPGTPQNVSDLPRPVHAAHAFQVHLKIASGALWGD